MGRLLDNNTPILGQFLGVVVRYRLGADLAKASGTLDSERNGGAQWFAGRDSKSRSQPVSIDTILSVGKSVARLVDGRSKNSGAQNISERLIEAKEGLASSVTSRLYSERLGCERLAFEAL